MKFNYGDPVQKIKGYPFPGVIVAAFRNTKGEERYVVECTAPWVEGCLHVFHPDQLELRG